MLTVDGWLAHHHNLSFPVPLTFNMASPAAGRRLGGLYRHLQRDVRPSSSSAAMYDNSLKDKVVLVTGGGDGIGGGMVKAFAASRACVVYCDLTEHADPPAGVHYIPCDVRDRGTIASVVASCIETHGGLHVLCNNVGVVLEAGKPLHETSDDAWDTTMAVNLTSYFQFSKHAIPQMLANGGGCIINTASVQGLQSMPGVCSYAASKGAISSLTRQMAVEYAAQGIRVNAICPGSIATPMNVKFQEDEGRTLEEAAESIPMKRIGGMEEIGATAVFLASQQASYITGQDIVVDGGLMAMGQWTN